MEGRENKIIASEPLRPEVVVLMSSYNGAEYIGEQLASIIDQSGVAVRLLVRDDGSVDNTPGILAGYARLYPDVVSVIAGSNVGYTASFGILIEEALLRFKDARWFAFADQDDYWECGKLSEAIRLMEDDGNTGIPYGYASNTLLVDGELRKIGLKWPSRPWQPSKASALLESRATGCTMVFNRSAAAIYASTKSDDISVHDFRMFQICVYLGKMIWDEKSYIRYRQHANNQIGQPSFMGRMKNRCKGLGFTSHVYEKQAAGLLKDIGSLMSEADRMFIRKFCDYRSNPLAKLKLLFNGKIRYSNLEQDFFYRIKILLGTV